MEKSSSRPKWSSANSAIRLAKARMEMPRITPGITSGASIKTDRACLPGKRPRSIKNALVVPTSAAENGDAAGNRATGPDAAQQLAVAEQPRAPASGVAEKPIQGEAVPRRRRVGRVVEGEHGHHDQWQKQEHEKYDQVRDRGAAQPGRSRQGGYHVRRITSPNRCPLTRSPTTTSAVERPRRRKPKAAPCSQLKRVMNWV